MEYRDQRPGFRRGMVPRDYAVEALVLGRDRSTRQNTAHPTRSEAAHVRARRSPTRPAALARVQAPPVGHRERSSAPRRACGTPPPLLLPGIAATTLLQTSRLRRGSEPGVEQGPHDVLAVFLASPRATDIENVRARSSGPPPIDRTGARSTIGVPHDPASFSPRTALGGGSKLGSTSSPWCRPWCPGGTTSTAARLHATEAPPRPPATFGSAASASS